MFGFGAVRFVIQAGEGSQASTRVEELNNNLSWLHSEPFASNTRVMGPLSRYTWRVAANFLRILGFFRCSSSIALHTPPKRPCRTCRPGTARSVARQVASEKVSRYSYTCGCRATLCNLWRPVSKLQNLRGQEAPGHFRPEGAEWLLQLAIVKSYPYPVPEIHFKGGKDPATGNRKNMQTLPSPSKQASRPQMGRGQGGYVKLVPAIMAFSIKTLLTWSCKVLLFLPTAAGSSLLWPRTGKRASASGAADNLCMRYPGEGFFISGHT